MDKSKISLLRASQILDIPYNTAKQILFIFSTPRRSRAMSNVTPTSSRSANSPITKTENDKTIKYSSPIQETDVKMHKYESNKKKYRHSAPTKVEKKPKIAFCD